MIKFDRKGKLLSIVLLFLTMGISQAQSCNCPSIDNCSPCSGGIIEYSLQYRGDTKATVSVKDQAAIVFTGELNPGEIFTVKGSTQDGRFAGSKIYLYIDGKENTWIDVLCTSNTVVNSQFGSFVIVAAKRLDGKSVCCGIGNKRDLIGPQFFLVPDDIIVFTDPEKCSAVVTWAMPKVTDCNLNGVSSNFGSGAEFPRGTTMVTYLATDNADNTSTFSFNVTVTDNLSPTISNCPSNISITTKEANGIPVSWDEPEATDNCTLASFLSTKTNGSVFPVGVTMVTYTATDQDSNTSTCIFSIEIILEKEPELPPVDPDRADLEIANIITPDGDGKNDVWILKNIEQFPENRVLILDRWGGQIFSVNSYNNESVVWRGTAPSSGKLSGGTYFYVISYSKQGVPVELRGFIELIP
jgi:gliding motility-associated-like protein